MQIILKLTTDCNLGCAYCSEGNQGSHRLSENTFYKLVDDLPALLTAKNENRVDFLFHGGEPLLYGREPLKKLINYAKSKLTAAKLNFLLQTNGTLVDDDWIKLFRDENISIGVSLDGYGEIHDKYRRNKHGEPTSQLVLANIRKLQAASVNVGTLMVMNSAEAIDAEKLYAFICDNKLHMKIHAVVPCGRASDRQDTDAVYEKYLALLKELLTMVLESDRKISIQPLDYLLDAILGISPVRECSYNGRCGSDLLCLYPDGEVGFCGRDNLSRQFIYGNIHEKTLLELYHSENAQTIRQRQEYLAQHDCQGCPEWDLCHGGCAYEAFNSFGNVMANYSHCQPWREFLHYLRTEGLSKFKQSLIREKIKHRELLRSKKNIMREIEGINLAGGDG